MDSRIIEDVATIKADVRHLSESFASYVGDRKSEAEKLSARVEAIEKGRTKEAAYAAGFGAGVAFLMAILRDKIAAILPALGVAWLS
jgi:ABC-type arginine transport system permease subunit